MEHFATPTVGILGYHTPPYSSPGINHVYPHDLALRVEYDLSDKGTTTLFVKPISAAPTRVEGFTTFLNHNVFRIPLMDVFVSTL